MNILSAAVYRGKEIKKGPLFCWGRIVTGNRDFQSLFINCSMIARADFSLRINENGRKGVRSSGKGNMRTGFFSFDNGIWNYISPPNSWAAII
jgi:hypothetical protein